MQRIELVFKDFTLRAELFDSDFAEKLLARLPFEVALTGWGRELYGPVGFSAVEGATVPAISPGGLAYTQNGDYFCIFFGQDPAWPVEHVGRIVGDDWKKLNSASGLNSVTIRPLVV